MTTGCNFNSRNMSRHFKQLKRKEKRKRRKVFTTKNILNKASFFSTVLNGNATPKTK